MSEPILEFDPERSRMMVTFNDPPTLAMLDAVAARLHTSGAKCLHVAIDMIYGAPRRIEQLEKALNPSLEAFIFDSLFDSPPRQSENTVGDIGNVLDACPNLRRAWFTGCSTMRKTRHDYIRELYITGHPLDPSVMSGLAASEFPALERLAIENGELCLPANALAASLRAIKAPRLSEVFVSGAPVIDFLMEIGTSALPWNLCVIDPCFDDVARLFEVIQQHDGLRSGKMRIYSGNFFAKEIAQLQAMGVNIAGAINIFSGCVYSDWIKR